jgi:hypothetical protein
VEPENEQHIPLDTQRFPDLLADTVSLKTFTDKSLSVTEQEM